MDLSEQQDDNDFGNDNAGDVSDSSYLQMDAAGYRFGGGSGTQDLPTSRSGSLDLGVGGGFGGLPDPGALANAAVDPAAGAGGFMGELTGGLGPAGTAGDEEKNEEEIENKRLELLLACALARCCGHQKNSKICKDILIKMLQHQWCVHLLVLPSLCVFLLAWLLCVLASASARHFRRPCCSCTVAVLMSLCHVFALFA